MRSATPVSPIPSAAPHDIEIDNIKAQLEALTVDSTVIILLVTISKVYNDFVRYLLHLTYTLLIASPMHF